MKTLITAFLIIVSLSGCITIQANMSMPKFEEIPEAQKIALRNKILGEAGPGSADTTSKKILFKDYSKKKTAFLMAFNKVGFDVFEITKLMTDRDDKELSVKKFLLKNKSRLYIGGALSEFIADAPLMNKRKDILDRIIEQIELNYKFFLKMPNEQIYVNLLNGSLRDDSAIRELRKKLE